jgi:uncharacterized protein YuzE
LNAPPDAGTLAQSAGESELDRPMKEAGQEALEAGEIDQGEPGVGIDLDQQIDVARRPGLTAGGRAEQRQAGDAAPSDVLGVGPQERNDALALGFVDRGLSFRGARHGVDMVAQIGLRETKEGSPMKLSYDPRCNIAHIRLRENGAEVETIRVSDELNVDRAPDGAVYGIELLNANEQLRAADDGRLVVEGEGKERTLALASEPRPRPARPTP